MSSSCLDIARAIGLDHHSIHLFSSWRLATFKSKKHVIIITVYRSLILVVTATILDRDIAFKQTRAQTATTLASRRWSCGARCCERRRTRSGPRTRTGSRLRSGPRSKTGSRLRSGTARASPERTKSGVVSRVTGEAIQRAPTVRPCAQLGSIGGNHGKLQAIQIPIVTKTTSPECRLQLNTNDLVSIDTVGNNSTENSHGAVAPFSTTVHV